MDSNSKQINKNRVLRYWQFIAFFSLLLASLAFLASTSIAPKYKSEVQILILQKNLDIDAYRAAKSSEFAGEVLKRVIGSSDFMQGVLSKMGISTSVYGKNSEDQIKNWNKSVSVSGIVNTGIVKITVLDGTRDGSKKLMEAIVEELQNNGFSYHGNEKITLKKISGPIYFENPAFPIIWLNVLVAFVSGIAFSIVAILLWGEKMEIFFSEKTRNRRRLEREIKKEIQLALKNSQLYN